ncbi:MAG: hypothetical protein KDA32_13510, partial [Phycisphaerales bacterium]|nr:hypothetical protein [Phycisphaerales bacterium]
MSAFVPTKPESPAPPKAIASRAAEGAEEGGPRSLHAELLAIAHRAVSADQYFRLVLDQVVDAFRSP